MRTTVTLDDDVAVQLDSFREARHLKAKEAINLALRAGLRQLHENREVEPEPYRIEPMDLGRCLVGSLDDVAEVLSIAEGEAFR